ncbi:hypothetical protein MJO29_014806 [Puccinia striiformis f. sp. tritici]|nr:hypothetical protein MJO29_014806 [Puccinia striiformis f. sp. tritici]
MIGLSADPSAIVSTGGEHLGQRPDQSRIIKGKKRNTIVSKRSRLPVDQLGRSVSVNDLVEGGLSLKRKGNGHVIIRDRGPVDQLGRNISGNDLIRVGLL